LLLLPTMPPQDHHELAWDGQMWRLKCFGTDFFCRDQFRVFGTTGSSSTNTRNPGHHFPALSVEHPTLHCPFLHYPPSPT
jgi:hypothetical protein